MLAKDSITIKDAIQRCTEQHELTYAEMYSVMQRMFRGENSAIVNAAFLVGLRVKKETIDEITAAAKALRDAATTVDGIKDRKHLVDIVGTGGDHSNTFNISTATSFVAAAAGARVAKHGNRGVSSCSGSADALEALGININQQKELICEAINTIGLGFMFAPNHHPAMLHLAEVRRELGIRTILNILGPLANPTQPPNQLMGVFHPSLVKIQAHVMKRLQADHVLVVHGMDGLDEFSLDQPTMVGELKNGLIEEYTVMPSEFGFARVPYSEFIVNNAKESADMIKLALSSKPSPQKNIVALNAGAAIYTANICVSLQEGVRIAMETIESGRAIQKLEEFSAFTQKFR